MNSEWQQNWLTDVLIYGDDDNDSSRERGPLYLEIDTRSTADDQPEARLESKEGEDPQDDWLDRQKLEG